VRDRCRANARRHRRQGHRRPDAEVAAQDGIAADEGDRASAVTEALAEVLHEVGKLLIDVKGGCGCRLRCRGQLRSQCCTQRCITGGPHELTTIHAHVCGLLHPQNGIGSVILNSTPSGAIVREKLFSWPVWQSEPGQAVLQELDIESNPVQQQVYVCLAQIGDEAAPGSRLEYPYTAHHGKSCLARDATSLRFIEKNEIGWHSLGQQDSTALPRSEV